MNKYREISRLRFLALILLVLFLPGCLGSAAKKTAAPPATATVGEQGQPVTAAATEVPVTNAPPAAEAASPTPQPVDETPPTETPAPTTEVTPGRPPTNTPAASANTQAPALPADVYEPIPGCARSRLHWGDTIRIAPEIEYVRIRSKPDTHPADNIVRKLYRTELAQTRGFPVCNYGWILWPIQTADGTRGWVAESDGTNFWLVKASPVGFPTATLPSR